MHFPRSVPQTWFRAILKREGLHLYYFVIISSLGTPSSRRDRRIIEFWTYAISRAEYIIIFNRKSQTADVAYAKKPDHEQTN